MKRKSPDPRADFARAISRRGFLAGAGQLAAGAAFGGLFGAFPSGAFAKFLPDAKAIADTTAGKIQGGMADNVYIFRGVPYGADTGGKHRFLPPQPVAKWTGVKECLDYGLSCPQAVTDYTKPAALSWFTPIAATTKGEDCLRLNIWTRGLKDGDKRPVMVWLHGGGFATGSGSSSSYTGINMCKRGDVVIVTVNHRLNVFGFTDLSQIFGEPYKDSGNAGMLDIVQALQWVHDNIANFGGDPGNVMIFGESGGGAKVSCLLAMPAAKGLFHRAAIQSGPGLTVNTAQASQSAATNLLDGLSAKDDLGKLQGLPAEQLVAAIGANANGFRPTLGAAIPQHPFTPGASPLSKNIPILIGTNKHEQALFSVAQPELFELTFETVTSRVSQLVGDRANDVVALYKKIYPSEDAASIYFQIASDQRFKMNSVKLAERKVEQAGAPVWMYRFEYYSPAWEGRFRAPHAFEIPFVFDNTQLNSDISGGTPEASALGARMSAAWIAFARKGNPNHAGMPPWPAYDKTKRATMIFDNVCQVKNDYDKEAREFWAGFTPADAQGPPARGTRTGRSGMTDES